MVKAFPSREIEVERLLRRRLKALLEKDKKFASAAEVLAGWERFGWRVLLFGGLLRDSAVSIKRPLPRDIDIVICNADLEELSHRLSPFITRRNRFGGLQLQISKWNFDVWPITSTWAFANGLRLEATPLNLTKTTFLNVEAITSEIRDGKLLEIYQTGFYEGVVKRTLDINLEDNPYPALAAARTLVTASKLEYFLSPRLARYVLHHAVQMGEESLVSAQDKHYGRVNFGTQEIVRICRDFEDQLSEERQHINLTRPLRGEQLRLWDDYSSDMPGSAMMGSSENRHPAASSWR
jgi:hypothetical protein